MSSQLNNNNNNNSYRRLGDSGSSSRGGRKRLIDVFDAAEEEATSAAASTTSEVDTITKNSKNNISINNKRLKVSSSTTNQTKTKKTKKKPLEGVIACLSGLPNDQKTKYHSMIENLGGRYSRVFDLDINTHLITMGPYGAKYELAKSSIQTKIIHIVSPTWIIECSNNNQRIPETQFNVVEKKEAEQKTTIMTDSGTNNENNIICKSQNLKKPPPPPPPQSSQKDHQQHRDHQQQKQQNMTTTSISQQIDELLSSNTTTTTNSSDSSCLFECQNILLIGFDDNDNDNDYQQQETKKKLSKLIRRGLGTIYWEMNDSITIMIFSDQCTNEKLFKVANLASKQHPNLPQIVSPTWIIDCYKTNRLLLPSISKYYPLPRGGQPTSTYQRQNTIIKGVGMRSGGGGGGGGGKMSTSTMTTTVTGQGINKKMLHPSSKATAATTTTGTDSTTTTTMMLTSTSSSSSQVFRDCLFTLVRIAPPHWSVDFDSQQQESFIKRHGGQIITLKVLDALKQDYSTTTITSNTTSGKGSNSSNPNNIHKKRKKRLCHVVCWGGGTTISNNKNKHNNRSKHQQQTNQEDWLLVNPILSQIYRLDLCDIVCVTPFWLQSCVQIEKRVKPNRIPSVFMPQPYPIRKALLVVLSNNNNNPSKTTAKTTTSANTTATSTINIAMTGFHWIERIAISNFIKEIGGNFHENLNEQTTHLVCKTNATGIKLTKAKQWKIHIVSIDWLYHIVQYGFYGKKGQQGKRNAAAAGLTKATKRKDDDDDLQGQSQKQQQKESSAKTTTTTTTTTTNNNNNEARNVDDDGGDENGIGCGEEEDDGVTIVGCESNFICV